MKFVIPFLVLFVSCTTQLKLNSNKNFVDNSFQWRTGHDESTLQLIPSGSNPLRNEENKTIVHVKFKVAQYGEVSFPINNKTPEGAEALPVDLSKSKGIQITYQSNQEFVIQLRQTGVHGGVHNHITLTAARKDTTLTISFSEFMGGKTPLDLSDAAKFNFAFLSNHKEDDYAELKISSFVVRKSRRYPEGYRY